MEGKLETEPIYTLTRITQEELEYLHDLVGKQSGSLSNSVFAVLDDLLEQGS